MSQGNLRLEAEMLKVHEECLEYGDDSLEYCAGVAFTGVAVNVVDGGITEHEYKDGLKDGESRAWYPSGVLRQRYKCRNGGHHGFYEEFYPDGGLKASGFYEYGIKVSMLEFDLTGRVSSQFVIGPGGQDWEMLLANRQKFGRW